MIREHTVEDSNETTAQGYENSLGLLDEDAARSTLLNKIKQGEEVVEFSHTDNYQFASEMAEQVKDHL